MRKKIKILTFCLFLSYMFGYSQIKNLDIKYGVYYNLSVEDRFEDVKELKKENPEIYEKIIKDEPEVKNIDFRLIYDGIHSITFGIDPKKQNLEELFDDFEGRDTIFTNLTNNKIYIYKHDYWGINLLLNYDYSKYKWNITNETKLIDDVICYKAILYYDTEDKKNTYTHKVVAWYNPQIKISIGPNGFGGLPGLIYQLDEGFRTYYIKEIKINQSDYKIKFETNRKRTKKLDLDTFRKTYDDIKREWKQMNMRN